MKSGKNAMETVKESAANVGASAKAGMEKTKATVQEKMEKVTAHDPLAKEIAEEKKQAKIHEAELHKKEAREHNAAVKQSTTATAPGTHGTHPTTHGTTTYSATGTEGYTTGTQQMSAVPGHDTGHPTGRVTEGIVGAHPIGTETGTGRTTTVTEGIVGAHPIGTETGTGRITTTHNPRHQGGGTTGYGTGTGTGTGTGGGYS